MRRMTGYYLYALVGLVLACVVAVGCAAEPAAEAPASAPTVSGEPRQSTTPAAPVSAASPPAESSPAATEAHPNATSATAFVDSGKRDLLALLALAYIRELAEDLGPRESATAQELKAAEHLLARFTGLGYDPELQEFEEKSQTAELTINAAEGAQTDSESVRTSPLNGSVAGDVSGPLEFVGLAKAEDIPAEGLDGKIALIQRGEISFGSKVEQVAGAGAVAAVIFNRESGGFQGTLRGESAIPAVAISREAGAKLRELMSGPDFEVSVAVQETVEPSRNVIAELHGTGEGVVVVGAHYDTVPGVSGANDNASGVGALLVLAGELADTPFPFTLRFIAFGSEETGLNGSRHYVDSLTDEGLDEIKAMINLDVIGAGDVLRVTGDRWLTRHVSEAAAREGIALGVSRGSRRGGSDHASFRDAWVPVIFFYADDMSRIHTPGDTMEFVSPGLLGETVVLVLDLLESLDDLRASPVSGPG